MLHRPTQHANLHVLPLRAHATLLALGRARTLSGAEVGLELLIARGQNLDLALRGLELESGPQMVRGESNNGREKIE